MGKLAGVIGAVRERLNPSLENKEKEMKSY
jgi:hypothetical protein